MKLSVDDVATQLKLPTAVIEAMERDDHGMLGAAVFARGRLGSYARLVGVPTDVLEAQFAHAAVAPPALVSNARSSRVEHTLRRFARQGIYVVLTATIVLPVIWLATHDQLPRSPVALTALDRPVAVALDPAARHASDANAAAGEARNAAPVVASIAPFGGYRWASAQTTGDVATAGLQLRFSGDSMVDIVGADGQVIEHGVVEAGSVRNYPAAAVARVTIRNAHSVLVLRNGEPYDMQAFQKANVTRFTVSSDGSFAPVRD